MGEEGTGLSLGISEVPSGVLASGVWNCAGTEADGEADTGLPPVCSVIIVASAFSLASVPTAGTTTAGRGVTGLGPITGAHAMGGRMVGADTAAETGEESIIASSWPPLSSSFAQVYTVLMMGGGVSVAVMVYPAAVKVVV